MFCFFFFFFFKQKTAYEMRISDWSSDVCSSDLVSRPWPSRIGSSPEDDGIIIRLGDCFRNRKLRTFTVAVLSAGAAVMPDGLFSTAPGILYTKIGRASCRERLCQYV